MLLFIDESGHNHQDMPCEVLAGMVVAEHNLWNMVRAIRSAEKDPGVLLALHGRVG